MINYINHDRTLSLDRFLKKINVNLLNFTSLNDPKYHKGIKTYRLI